MQFLKRNSHSEKKVPHIICLILLIIGFIGDVKAEIGRGDWLMRTGYTFLLPQLKNDSLIEIDQYGMPTISFSYLMTENLAIEFLAGIPDGIDIKERATGFNTKIATFTPISPNATVQYYLNHIDSKFRPYIGLGLLYSTFHNEKTYGILQGASFNIEPSLDPIAQIGFDYAFNERFALNVDVRKLYTSTTAVANHLNQETVGMNAPSQMDLSMGMEPLTVSLNFVLFIDIPEKNHDRLTKDRVIIERIKQRREEKKLFHN